MSARAEGDREERALEALIASAFCRDNQPDADVPPGRLPTLSEEKERVLDELGNDFVQRLLSGQLHRPVVAPPSFSDRPLEELAFAGESACFGLDRAEDVDDETQAELDEQRRQIRDRKRRDGRDDEEKARD